MHGIIFAEFRRYAEARLGPAVWPTLAEQAGLANRMFLMAEQFPDVEFQALVVAAAGRMKLPLAAVLEDFGEFLAPDLLKMHAHSVPADWRTLELIEHTEEAIHQVVRQGNPNAFPPRIACTRVGEHEVVIRYTSQRKLCALAKGIVRGVAAHYGEGIRITESTCMLQGADCCTIAVEAGPHLT
jgi:hypothetical protein